MEEIAVLTPSSKRKRAPAFTEREDEILIGAYSKRRRILECSSKEGIKPAHKQACWEEISAEVSAVLFMLK